MIYVMSFLSYVLTLIWVCVYVRVGGGGGGNFTYPPVGFPLITQKR